MDQSTKKKLKLVLIFILLVAFIYPFIRETDFERFLNHPIEKTDLDWKKQSVDCMKNKLPETEVFGLKVIGNIDPSAVMMTEFQLQYLFAPIILDKYDPWEYDFTIVYLLDSDVLLSDEINERQVKAECNEKILLVEK